MMFLEEAPGSTGDVKIESTAPYRPDPVFGSAPSYAERYAILLDRLYRDGVYSAACLVTSSAHPASPVHEPVPALSFRNFAASVKGRATEVLSMEPPGSSGAQLF